MDDHDATARPAAIVGELMQPDVVSIAAGASVQRAAALMRARAVGCLPVLEGDRVVGMLTARDLVVRGLAATVDLRSWCVADVMSAGPLSVFPDQSVAVAADIMANTGVRRLIVVDRQGRLCGLLTAADIGAPERRRPMPARVAFFRCIVDSRGQPHRSELCRVHLSPGVPADAVEPRAIERFEHTHGDRPWRLVADGYEVGEG